jgi:hypothetical protein
LAGGCRSNRRPTTRTYSPLRVARPEWSV